MRPMRLGVVGVIGAVAVCLGSVSAVAVAPPVQSRANAAASTPSAVAPGESADLTSASQQAAASNTPVVVGDQTTETSQVTANPDGTFTLNSSLQPQRVQQNGTWVPVNTDLQTAPDGALAPAAAADNVEFSDGGSGPLVHLTDGSDEVSLSWPSPLPVPTVSGSVATYSSVLPGVDLRVTALAASYSEVLVVHSAVAATNPALAHEQITVAATGLSLSKDAQGGLSATDASGNEVLQGSPPIMWDSSDSPQAGVVPTASNPGGAPITKLGLAMSAASGTSSTLTLTPPAAALTGANVTYPVYIDPSMSPARTHFAVVFNNGWDYYDDTSNDLDVGYCGWPGCNGIGVGRTYLAFDTSALTGAPTTAQIYTAAVQPYEIHNATGCTPASVDLYTSGAISSSTSWPGPIGSKLDEEPSNDGDSCGSGNAGVVNFNNANVLNDVQSAANNDTTKLYFTLRAPDENQTSAAANDWKKFSSSGSSVLGGPGAQLVVTYAFPPSTPTGLKITNSVACSGKPVYVSDTSPTLWAKATDNNPSPESVNLFYTVDTSGGTQLVQSGPQNAASDAETAWTDSAILTSGSSYRYDVFARSDSPNTANPQGATSAWYPFTVDTSKPSTPTLQTNDYPTGSWGAPAGQGSFALSTSSDAVGFAYSWDTSTITAPANTTCSYSQTSGSGGMLPASGGAASLTVPTTLSAGPHTLYVEAFDAAHNVSSPKSYSFYVAPSIFGEGDTVSEAESLAITPTNPAVDSSYVESGSGYSNGEEVRLVADGTGQTFSVPLTAPIDADYDLAVQLGTANHFGNLTFSVDNGSALANGAGVIITADTYSASPGVQYVDLGGVHLGAGVHHLKVTVTGTDTSSTSFTYNGTYGVTGTPQDTLTSYADGGYSAGVDYIRLTPVNDVAATSFSAAMNNAGIAVDNTTPADMDLYGGSDYALSENQLALVGLGYGKTKTFTGITDTAGGTQSVSFTMPDRNSAGYDNVVADGQTIPLPTPLAAANDVDLLAVAACGSTPSTASTELSINYTDGFVSNGILGKVPSVPDWVTGAVPSGVNGIALAATLPYRDVGPNAATTGAPTNVYILSFPTQDPGVALSSVTLPTIGSNFLCGSPVLHILAMTTN